MGKASRAETAGKAAKRILIMLFRLKTGFRGKAATDDMPN